MKCTCPAVELMQRVVVLSSVLALTISPVRVDFTPPFDETPKVLVLAAFEGAGEDLSAERRLEPRPRTGPGSAQAEDDGAFSAEETEMVLRFGAGLGCDRNEFPASRGRREDPSGLRGLDVMSRGPPSHFREQPDRLAGAPIVLLSSRPSSS
jgi:hypothetical protein